MLLSARIVLADGTVLDTGDEESKKQFAEKKPEFVQKIKDDARKQPLLPAGHRAGAGRSADLDEREPV